MTTFQFLWVVEVLISATSVDIMIAPIGHSSPPNLSEYRSLIADDLVGCTSTSPRKSDIQAQVNAFRTFENTFRLGKADAVLQKLLDEDRCRHIPDSDGTQIADLLLRSIGNAIADNDARSASHYIKTLLQTFPTIEPTLQRFPPKTVAAWQAERSKVQTPMRQIEVWTTQPGVLTTDGKPLAQLQTGRNQLTLPAELRRVWVESSTATSLIRYLEHAPKSAQTLVFLPELESTLIASTSGAVVDNCSLSCRQTLQLLANTHHRSLSLRPSDGSQALVIKRGDPIESHVTMLTSATHQRGQLSSTIAWTDFLPLGIAQARQERWVSGGLWAVSQVTLAALSIWQFNRVDDTTLSTDERERAKSLTNIFATGFYISLAGSVTDSMIWRRAQEAPTDSGK